MHQQGHHGVRDDGAVHRRVLPVVQRVADEVALSIGDVPAWTQQLLTARTARKDLAASAHRQESWPNRSSSSIPQVHKMKSSHGSSAGDGRHFHKNQGRDTNCRFVLMHTKYLDMMLIVHHTDHNINIDPGTA
jgi:hypothetical protein